MWCRSQVGTRFILKIEPMHYADLLSDFLVCLARSALRSLTWLWSATGKNRHHAYSPRSREKRHYWNPKASVNMSVVETGHDQLWRLYCGWNTAEMGPVKSEGKTFILKCCAFGGFGYNNTSQMCWITKFGRIQLCQLCHGSDHLLWQIGSLVLMCKLFNLKTCNQLIFLQWNQMETSWNKNLKHVQVYKLN